MFPRFRRALPTAALCTVLAAFSACSAPAPDDEQHFLTEIQEYRKQKDEAFLQEGSPVPADRRKMLVPLAYFPPSLDYRVPAVLKPSDERPTIDMPTSTGQLRKMMRVGRLEFSLRGTPLALSAFVEAGSRDLNRLFVPFTDLTSGTETYPAGRYMDLERTPTGLYVIDFNRAYHPFCYYSPVYDCPYPPRENRLQIPVRAGEKMRSAEPRAVRTDGAADAAGAAAR
jgi:uncharacterized protein (DUF1684 family)